MQPRLRSLRVMLARGKGPRQVRFPYSVNRPRDTNIEYRCSVLKRYAGMADRGQRLIALAQQLPDRSSGIIQTLGARASSPTLVSIETATIIGAQRPAPVVMRRVMTLFLSACLDSKTPKITASSHADNVTRARPCLNQVSIGDDLDQCRTSVGKRFIECRTQLFDRCAVHVEPCDQLGAEDLHGAATIVLVQKDLGNPVAESDGSHKPSNILPGGLGRFVIADGHYQQRWEIPLLRERCAHLRVIHTEGGQLQGARDLLAAVRSGWRLHRHSTPGASQLVRIRTSDDPVRPRLQPQVAPRQHRPAVGVRARQYALFRLEHVDPRPCTMAPTSSWSR